MNEKVMVFKGERFKQAVPQQENRFGPLCNGCSFYEDGECLTSECMEAIRDTFGQDCFQAGVIYVKDE